MKREYQGRVEVVVVDNRKEARVARKYGIRKIPTVILQDASGSEAGRWEGARSREFLVGEFARIGVK